MDVTEKYFTVALSSEAYLSFNFVKPISELTSWDPMFVWLIQPDQKKKRRKSLLYKDLLYPGINELKQHLERAREGKLLLDRSIKIDLGLTFEESSMDVSLHHDWKGMDYHIWSLPGYVRPQWHTWLFDYEGQLFFEVTPGWPWMFCKRQRYENWYSYRQFKQNYHPLVVITLSHDVQKTLLKNLNELIDALKCYQCGHLRYNCVCGIYDDLKKSSFEDK